MFKISHAANAFSALDKTPEEKFPSLDKALRNLSQRVYLPPDDREGRADLYDPASVCALRLLYKASVFGLDRMQLEDLARFLLSAPIGPGRYEAMQGAKRKLTVVQEAIERVQEGQDFDIAVVMSRDGRMALETDWSHPEEDNPELEAFRSQLPSHHPDEDARFILAASRLIRELLTALED